jgi:cytochrome c oxidase subunit 2
MQGGLPLFPERASSIAGRVDALFFFLLGVALFFSLIITVTIVYFAVKYRRRAPDQIGALITGSTNLETAWIVIPLILAMVMFGWGASLFLTMQTPPRDALEVYVVGKQWMWKLQHPEGQKEINELHVPVGREIKLTLTSEDVIHDFFVPAFRIKTDVLPGRYSTLWFKATRPGRYHLFCSQYCGTNHAIMGGWVTVMEPAEFQTWLSGGPAEGSLASAGEKLFHALACDTCHRSDSQGRGPKLDGLYGSMVRLENRQSVLADEGYIRQSILDPKAKIVAGYEPNMPTFQGLVTEEQVLQLIAYIKSLGPPRAPPGAASPAAGRTALQRENTKRP